MNAVPVLTFFGNKRGVGKTSLVYHLAWMLTRIGHRVLACDLDPQANLTTAFLDEGKLENLWGATKPVRPAGRTIFQCVQPLMEASDIVTPTLVEITPPLALIPGDLALSGFEDTLATAWTRTLDTDPDRALRILTAFSHVMQAGAQAMQASVILADIGPNLGAINRSALIATDHVIVPLGTDLLSLQSLRNLGPTLRRWRQDWQLHYRKQMDDIPFALPQGRMWPVGYVTQRPGVRLGSPIRVYDEWVNRMPEEYSRNLLAQDNHAYPATPGEDPHCLATVKPYRGLMSLAQEHRKPIFDLTPADGAIGSHAAASRDAYHDFEDLARRICQQTDLIPHPPRLNQAPDDSLWPGLD